MPQPEDDWNDWVHEEEDYEEEFECGFISGYGCQLAGTEDCDWECPYSNELRKHPDYPNVMLAALPYIKVIALKTSHP